MLEARALLRVARWLAGTWEVHVEGPAPDLAKRHVYAFLHGHQLPMLRYPRRREVAVLASLSRDGEIQTRVLSAMGFSVVRGSSSRGGAGGLAALVRAVRAGADAAIAVDGPRGPRGAAKAGAVFLARASGALVVPVAAGARRAAVLGRTWDRFVVPAPWTRVVLLRGEAFGVARSAGEGDVEAARSRLESSLEELDRSARALARGGGEGKGVR